MLTRPVASRPIPICRSCRIDCLEITTAGTMSDTPQLENEILAAIAAAGDEAGARSGARRGAGQERLAHRAVEDARHAAAGRAQNPRPADQRPQGSRQRRARRAPRRVQGRGARSAAQLRKHRRHAAGARSAGRDRPRPSDHPGDRRTHRDLRRYGLRRRRRSGHRDRRLQFHQAEFPGRSSGARDARHVLLQSEAGRLAALAAHPHLAGAGAHHADAEAADPRHLSRPHLSLRFAIRPTRRCSIRSKASSSTSARISAT